jgi:adenosine deaminase
VASLGALSACTATPPNPAAATAHYLDRIRDDPAKLDAFLLAFPKGADLHNHLSGAIYAESFIGWAIADGLCIDENELALTKGPCGPNLVPASALRQNRPLYDALVGAFSMKDFRPDGETGHDHFFSAFDKFAAAETDREGDMLAQALQQAANDHTVYLELMWSPGMPAARRLARKVGWDGNLRKVRNKLIAAGIDQIVPVARREVDQREARARALLHCADPARRRSGCNVTVRYLAQIIRVFPPAEVFAQDVLAFRLVEADPRFVGLNIVGPEDDPISLHDYSLHMRMFQYLHGLDPRVAMSLHAGELVEGLRGGLRRVRPEDMRFHIREAVEIAGARRIGHGVDIEHENDWRELMADMAARHILVEINLTSNAQILGITGAAHPFLTYWTARVPVALSTDDEGVERIDLTHEYVRATREYHLSFGQLVTLSRNAVAYGFEPGANLWADIDHFVPNAACASDTIGAAEPSGPCAALLAKSLKARLQWQLEAALTRFEIAHQ